MVLRGENSPEAPTYSCIPLFVMFFFLIFFPQGYSKRVTWLLGRDGDVSVSVIGGVDEFRSSKILQSLMNNR